MNKRVLTAGVGIVLAMAVFSIGSLSLAAPPLQWRSVITYPEPGMTVSGSVEIKGYAVHANLDHYQVRYAPGTNVVADSAWVDIVPFVTNPVENDVLCTWDTTTLPDGPYVLAVAVWGVEDPSNPHLHFVEHVVVDNSSLPTTSAPTPESLPTVAVGPSPTPVTIDLPATPTPRPSPTPVPGQEEATPTPEQEEESGAGFTLNTPMLREAFCTGGMITVMLFLLWGLYILARASIRWYLRDTTSVSRE